MRVDAVICSPNDEKFAAASNSLKNCDALAIDRIVRVPDAKSMCEGYNRGAEQAEADWLLFCHDDIAVIDWNANTLAEAFRNWDVFGVSGTARLTAPNWYDSTPNLLRGSVLAPADKQGRVEHQLFCTPAQRIWEAQALDGIFIACRRLVWADLRFDEAIEGFTGYDVDFSYRSYLSGYRLGVIGDLILYHASHVGDFSPEKIIKWENTQAALREKFAFRGLSEGYVKHDAKLYETLEDFRLRNAVDRDI